MQTIQRAALCVQRENGRQNGWYMPRFLAVHSSNKDLQVHYFGKGTYQASIKIVDSTNNIASFFMF
jgi:hypothetical protein